MRFFFKAALLLSLVEANLCWADLKTLGERTSQAQVAQCHPLLTYTRNLLANSLEGQRRQMILRHLFMPEAQFALGINRQSMQLMAIVDEKIETSRKVIDVPWEKDDMQVVVCALCEADDENLYSDELIWKRIEYFNLPYKDVDFQLRFPSVLDNKGKKLRRLRIDLRNTTLPSLSEAAGAISQVETDNWQKKLTDDLKFVLKPVKQTYPKFKPTISWPRYIAEQKTFIFLLEWEEQMDTEIFEPLRQFLRVLHK